MFRKLSYLFVFVSILISTTFFIFENEQSKKDEAVEVNNPIATEQEEPPSQISVEEMHLHEKIGQMLFVGVSGKSLTEAEKTLIRNNHVGGVILFKENLTSPEQAIQLINEIKELNQDNKAPLFIGVDQEGGRITRLPGNLVPLPSNQAIGEMNSIEYAYEVGTLLGKQVKAFGFNVNFAPVLDVNSNPNNPIIGDRAFGDKVEIVQELGIETMKGIEAEKIIPVIKHFPGHGDTSVDSHLELPTVNKSLKELKELELIPFEAAINEGADMVMIAHILLPKIDDTYPSSMSKKVITQMLRKELDFNGVVITDDMTMEAITDNYLIDQAAVESVKAGSDIIMVAHDDQKVVAVMNAIEKAVHKGEISEESINESVERILQVKDKYRVTDEKVRGQSVDELNKLTEKTLDKYKDCCK
ncbi:beta-N-acetylhexosaminidase [Salirhabdus sp. Marseille-P4669]|uniref:beta-N-acetylhexosaminidase n=1 Tax=Salirhabdus sp. Marseille-P4669 TaxID=2042310 RepID=UPI000C7B417B|nr:beta-N-acetylhexosaminidase [Salirhabdus sp. Marseille-P4669]